MASQSVVPVPLSYVWAGIKVRPLGGATSTRRTLSRTNIISRQQQPAGGGAASISSTPPAGSGGWIHFHDPIHWRTLTAEREQLSQLKCCPAINAYQPPYR